MSALNETQHNPTPNPFRIAIIGGGPSGLTLARLLTHGVSSSDSDQSCSIEVTVYESDLSPTTRRHTDNSNTSTPQGGSLDLHHDGGLLAVERMGLTEEFDKLKREGEDEMRVCDGSTGKVRFGIGGDEGPPGEHGPGEHGGHHGPGEDDEHHGPGEDDGHHGPDEERPEIDRAHLRSMLLAALEPSVIKWNHRLLSITSSSTSPPTSTNVSPDPPYTLRFSSCSPSASAEPTPDAPSEPSILNEVTAHAELVIGADGAFSKVRPLVTPHKPSYTGLSMFDMTVLPPISTGASSTTVDSDHGRATPAYSEAYERALALTGKGLAFFLGGRKGVIAQRNSNGVVKVYVSFHTEGSDAADGGKGNRTTIEDWPKSKTGDEVKAKVLRDFEDYDDGILDLVRIADTKSITFRHIHALPPTPAYYTHASSSGITLIGDAAHLMSPFAGEGVNLGMRDAVELAQSLLGYLGVNPSDVGTAADGAEAELTSLRAVLDAVRDKMYARALRSAVISARNLEIAMGDDAVERWIGEMRKMMGGMVPGPGGEHEAVVAHEAGGDFGNVGEGEI